ncbi:MAG: hypothetical protein ACXVFB_16255 [Gaiellaceae bacterium]
MITFRVWLIELPVAALNYFVLIKRVYEPRVGELRAHQIGMSTRIAYVFIFAIFLDRFAHADSVGNYVFAGAFWTLLWLAFEWIGSFITRRSVHEILAGWHIENGYMWPYVLLAYLLSPAVVGLLLSPGYRSAL